MLLDKIKLDAANESDFEAYRHLYSRAAETSLTGGRFQAQVKIFRVPRMVIFERRVGGVVHRRDWARVGRDGFDHITLHIPIAGDLVAGPVGEERRLQSGEILVLDTSRPHVSQLEKTHLFSVQLARAHVQAVLGDVDCLHGSVLPKPAGGMLADFVASFARRIETLPPDTMGHVARATIELFGLGVRNLQVSDTALSAVSGDTLWRTRAEAFITAHLADPGLNADAVAAGIGTSRTILYRVFSDEGGVKQFIQRQRLDGLRRALLTPGEERRLGCLAHAYGFASQSHCNRIFAAAFGLPPGQFRTKFGRARTRDTHSGPDERIIKWTSELY
jgi:AraC-like DNA-binding protein